MSLLTRITRIIKPTKVKSVPTTEIDFTPLDKAVRTIVKRSNSKASLLLQVVGDNSPSEYFRIKKAVRGRRGVTRWTSEKYLSSQLAFEHYCEDLEHFGFVV